MHLAVARAYAPKWSALIHEEWIRNLLLNRPDLSRETLEGTRDMMQSAVLNALVEGFEPLMPTLSLPDAGDRHVLAAAIEGGADVLVTWNLKDFPPQNLAAFGLVAQTPDEFIHELMNFDEERVVLAIRRQRALLKKPTKTVEEHLQTLEEQGLKRVVARLRLRVGKL